MVALEREIIDKFWQLPPEGRRRVLSSLQKIQANQITIEAWLAEAEQVSITLQPDASGNMPSTSDTVNEVREERDADILRSLGFRDISGDRTE